MKFLSRQLYFCLSADFSLSVVKTPSSVVRMKKIKGLLQYGMVSPKLRYIKRKEISIFISVGKNAIVQTESQLIIALRCLQIVQHKF